MLAHSIVMVFGKGRFFTTVAWAVANAYTHRITERIDRL